MMLSQGPEELSAHLEDTKYSTLELSMYEQFRWAAPTPGGGHGVLWDNYNLTEKFLSC